MLITFYLFLWTTFLLVSLEDKLMPRKRERVSHVGNAECLTQSPVLNSKAECTTTSKEVCKTGERHSEEFWMVRSREEGLSLGGWIIKITKKISNNKRSYFCF